MNTYKVTYRIVDPSDNLKMLEKEIKSGAVSYDAPTQMFIFPEVALIPGGTVLQVEIISSEPTSVPEVLPPAPSVQ